MRNEDIRNYARVCGVLLWQVAEEMHIQDSSLSRKLRRELSADEKRAFKSIIDRIAAKRASGEF